MSRNTITVLVLIYHSHKRSGAVFKNVLHTNYFISDGCQESLREVDSTFPIDEQGHSKGMVDSGKNTISSHSIVS
jgi:hypothetical protein